MQCPVVRTIQEIRGGNWYVDDTDDTATDTKNVIYYRPEFTKNKKIINGGSETTDLKPVVCDDMQFYITSRMMSLARFELSKPDDEAIGRKSAIMFKDIVGKNKSDIVIHLIDNAMPKHIYKQFVQLINIIGDMEDIIVIKLRTMKQINISLPDIFLLPYIDRLIVYRPDVLCDTINAVTVYMNKLNVNSMLSEPIKTPISSVDRFEAAEPTSAVGSELPKTIEEMHEMLNAELEVAKYLVKVEAYQCKVINHMGLIYDRCKKIITDLTVK